MIEFDTTKFESWTKEVSGELHTKAERALLLTAQATATYAKQTRLFKNRSGELRKSIRGELHGNLEARTVADAKHAYWVENGNKPAGSDWIYPTKSKFLRFTIDGTTFFRKRVRPAAPRPFMHEAREAAVPLFERLMAAGMAGVFSG